MRQKKLKENFRYQHQARNSLQQTAEQALVFQIEPKLSIYHIPVTRILMDFMYIMKELVLALIEYMYQLTIFMPRIDVAR